MKIITLNCGSSSVKYALFDMPSRKRLSYGIVQRVTLTGSFIEHYDAHNQKSTHRRECPTHAVAIALVMEFLTNPQAGGIKDLAEVNGFGHRVVHGGEKFTSAVVINDEVIRSVAEFSMLAPLHNPANLAGIRAAMQLAPDVPHVAIFDTAFLATMPPHAYIYALPYEWYEKYHIRRYGFHGTSHGYVSKRAAAFLGRKPAAVNLITLHIGNGVSITAVKDGAAYDHSMGFTPLEGAVMGTRCGDIDPAIPLYVMQQENLSSAEMESILNRNSGLLGITGKYVDRRDILAAMQAGDKRAVLSFEIECYRLRKYIGAYLAALGRVDAVVFTAGVGENSPRHRAKICEGLDGLGIKLAEDRNRQAVGGQEEMEINAPDSPVKVLVIPTNEELAFAEEVFSLVGKGRDNLY
ncbi:MAG: acetate kinase [Chloroflexota bacterium]|nr:acetate kinase [Chloroflexota bacterium]